MHASRVLCDNASTPRSSLPAPVVVASTAAAKRLLTRDASPDAVAPVTRPGAVEMNGRAGNALNAGVRAKPLK